MIIKAARTWTWRLTFICDQG